MEGNLLNLLIVENERSVRNACREVALSLGFNIQAADSLEHALRILDSASIDVVLLDSRSPGGTGTDGFHQVKQRRPEAVVIVLTGFTTVNSAIQAMRAGAYDYITKPFNFDQLRIVLERVICHIKLKQENRLLREQVRARQGFGPLVGHAPVMEKLYRIIAKAAYSTHPVVILGESGTGKELVARAIHYSGCYKDKPFIPVDCGAIVPELVERELFGCTKGASVGAAHAQEGLLASAHGGTLFLDEISELPIDVQTKLMRALEEHEIHPIGSARASSIQVRILAATSRDLERAVQQGAFRRDLYFRLNVLSLRIPPLRERKEDIPLLIGHIVEKINSKHDMQHSVGDDALRLMLDYSWPGNVRELEVCLESACSTCSFPTIHVVDLPSPLKEFHQTHASAPPGGESRPIRPLAELEKEAILHAIRKLSGDKLEAARQLGIGKTTLYRKLKEYSNG